HVGLLFTMRLARRSSLFPYTTLFRSPEFKPLVETTAEGFTVDEVSADKAYLSAENVEAVYAAGGMPYIAFKSKAPAGSAGCSRRDRKSTRLNSSHGSISYAVFCLKKK